MVALPTPMMFHRTTVFRILALLGLLLSRSASSFAPSFRTSRGPSFRTPTAGTHRTAALSVFATTDAEEVRKPKKNSADDESSSSSSWTPVEGGFLPKFRPPKKAPPKTGVREVRSLPDYKSTVVEEPERITVVRFYAPWCRACRAVKAKYHRLSRQHDASRVQFVDVPLTQESAVLHTGLGVPSLPYGHIYHPEAGLVEERKINKHEFGRFTHILDTYVQGYCDVEYKEDGATELLLCRTSI